MMGVIDEEPKERPMKGAETIRIGELCARLTCGADGTHGAEARPIAGVIFDLDGVLVHTDRMHYKAWAQTCRELGLAFDERVNHLLRGVSREDSLRIILAQDHNEGVRLSDEDFARALVRKNELYRTLLEELTPGDVETELRGALADLRAAGLRLAVGSSSKNTRFILERTGLADAFDAVVDGHMIGRSKPDPEVFVRAAELIDVPCIACAVVEDATAGLKAARAAGMLAIAVGDLAATGAGDVNLS